MKYHREFEIPWFGLKEGLHEFRYQVTDKVVEQLGHEHPDYENLDATVLLKFDKQNGFFQLHFDIDGKVDVACDRCGDTFRMSLWDEFDLIIKLTSEQEENEEKEEDEADIVFIPRSETVVDVSKWVYEFVLLSMPMQHIHPNKEDGSSGCNPEALKLLEQMSAKEETRKNTWSGLDKLKGLDFEEEKN